MRTKLILLAAALLGVSLGSGVIIAQMPKAEKLVSKPTVQVEIQTTHRAAPKSAPAKPAPIDNKVFVDKSYVELASRVGWKGAVTMADQIDGDARKARDKSRFESWLVEKKIEVFEDQRVGEYMDDIVGDLNRQERDRCKKEDKSRIESVLLVTNYCEVYAAHYYWDWFPLKGREYGSVTYNLTSPVLSISNGDSSRVTSGVTSERSGTFQTGSITSTDAVLIATTTPPSITYSTASDFGGHLTAATKTVKTENGYREDYILPIPKPVLDLMATVLDAFPKAEFDVSAVDRKVDPFLRVRFDWGFEIIARWDEPGF